MGNKSCEGQVELILLIPLLLAILLLNVALIHTLSNGNGSVSKMQSEYQRLLSYNYTIDDATGNRYP